MVLLRQCADRPSARKAEKYFKSGFGLPALPLVGSRLGASTWTDCSNVN